MVLLKMYSTYPYTLFYILSPLKGFGNKEAREHEISYVLIWANEGYLLHYRIC